MKKKALVAMSGGVDSAVAALLLQNAGYTVCGVTLRLHGPMEDNACCGTQDIEDARAVCRTLGIAHEVLDDSGHFHERVIRPFVDGYLRGETPNPCIECNRHIKFKALYDAAKADGFDHFATGHYVRVRFDEASNRYLLLRGYDRAKDQSYVLYTLPQEHLAMALFPLGGLDKQEVRALAAAAGFSNSAKPDSQDICFVPDGDYADYIKRERGLPSTPGPFVTTEGQVLGTHRGVFGYTTGQRRGLGIAYERPLYVLKKDMANNAVVLGDDRELYQSRISCRDVNLIAVERLTEPLRVEAKIRYSQSTSPALLSTGDGCRAVLHFEEPQRAPTPGQSAVFYSGDVVLGGGIIE